ncbi:MAG TPA: hypothetical protein VN112_16230 [Ensifer sp.]|nr:hypothetical protein [Ensifer sp.]
MAGPWEKYQQQGGAPALADGPWAKYAQQPATPDAPAVAPQPDVGGGGINGIVRTLARGALGVGAYADEADAGLNAILAPVIDPLLPDSFQKLPEDSLSGRYEHALRIQRGQDQQFDENHPVASPLLKIAGGVASAGGLINKAPAVADFVLGNGGANVPTRILATMGAGAGTGAVQGFGEGEGGVGPRAGEALKEGVIGGLMSGAMMPLATGFNWGTSKLAKALMGERNDVLSNLSSGAREYLTGQLADPERVAQYGKSLGELGDQAVLADVSPEWFGVARGAAARPGTRDIVVNPLKDRAASANARLGADIRQSLGPDPIPSQVSSGIDDSLAQVSKAYGPAFESRTPFDFSPIAGDLDRQITTLRGDPQKALQRVRGMLNDFGKDEVTTDPAVAFQTRQAIDGMLATEKDPKVISALADARQMIDDGLTQSVPRIKEIDAQFAELKRQQEALGQGRPILNNEATAMRPAELDQALSRGALPQGMQVGPSAVPTRMQQGALGEIYRAAGTKANDTTALRNIVRGEGDWNREKLGMLFGQDNADRALKAIDRETIFGDTANRVERGSDTSVTNGFSNFLNDVSRSQELPNDVTLTGLALKGTKGLVKALLEGNAEANASKFANELGALSVAKGADRDKLVEALLVRGKQNVIDKQRMALISSLMKGGAQAATPMVSHAVFGQ